MDQLSLDSSSQVPSLARAVRFGFAAIVVGMSYPNIQLVLRLHTFEQVFRDMLGDKPLPVATALVLHAQPFLLGSSFVIPLVAVAVIFVRRLAASIYICGVMILLVFFQLFFTWQAVTAPLFAITQ